METSLVHIHPNTSKIDSFDGILFKRRQKNVFFAMDIVNLGHVLTDPKP